MADVEIKVDQALIRSVLDAKIQTAIASELLGAKEVIETVIAQVLRVRVDDKGRVVSKGDYSRYTTYPLVEGLAQNAIREAVHRSVCAWVEGQQPQIRAAVEAELEKQKSGLAALMVSGLAKCIEESWRMTINCQFQSDGD